MRHHGAYVWCVSTTTTLSASRGDAQEDYMPVKEASSEETPYGRYMTSEGWFVLNLSDALAVRNEERAARSFARAAGGAVQRHRRQRQRRLAGRAERAVPLRRACRKGSSCSRASAR